MYITSEMAKIKIFLVHEIATSDICGRLEYPIVFCESVENFIESPKLSFNYHIISLVFNTCQLPQDISSRKRHFFVMNEKQILVFLAKALQIQTATNVPISLYNQPLWLILISYRHYQMTSMSCHTYWHLQNTCCHVTVAVRLWQKPCAKRW